MRWHPGTATLARAARGRASCQRWTPKEFRVWGSGCLPEAPKYSLTERLWFFAVAMFAFCADGIRVVT